MTRRARLRLVLAAVWEGTQLAALIYAALLVLRQIRGDRRG